MGSLENNKRKSERLPSLLFVEIKSDGTKEALGRGVALNISAGGFQLESESNLKKGSKYLFLFEIPFTFPGEVVWSIPKGQIRQYGLKFSDLSFLDKFIVKKFLKGSRRNRRI